MKILVTGSRYWKDIKSIFKVLETFNPTEIIEGGAIGADAVARSYAGLFPIRCRTFEADWGQHVLAAGPIRNSQMINEMPDLVLAFHDNLESSKGTKDCVNKALNKGLKVHHYKHDKDGNIIEEVLSKRIP